MKIGIHNSKASFSKRWIEYCIAQGIPYKVVNCYQSDIIKQLEDCDALMWHFHHASPKDFLFAKQLLYSISASGKKVFPDFNTVWHFDDKVGQKYLLEAIKAPLVPSYVFYSKKEALKWANSALFPKVFKLRCGAGSANVKLVDDKSSAVKFICKSFGRGFRQYGGTSSFKERVYQYRHGRDTFAGILKGLARIIISTEFSRTKGNEKGYVYFQDFIPCNSSDTRVFVVGDKACALKRVVRENNFRASGSGRILYEKNDIDERCVDKAFKINEKLRAQCLSYDFLLDSNDEPLITEISFGFPLNFYDACAGYWDKNMNWHEGKFNPQGWMVDLIIKG